MVLKGQTLDIDIEGGGGGGGGGDVIGLSRDALEREVCHEYEALAFCFQRATSPSADLDGTIGLRWTLDTQGSAKDPLWAGTIAKDDALKACIWERMQKLRLATPTRNETLSYAFSVHAPPASLTKLVPDPIDCKLPTGKKPVVPILSETDAVVVGTRPATVVKRIIRANFPRFRACYEQGLKANPTLAGTVVTELVIDETGAPESVKSAGGTLGDDQVKSCVTGVFRTLSFPEPEAGKVKVTYPLHFKPDI